MSVGDRAGATALAAEPGHAAGSPRYGHLAHDAEEHDRLMLEAFDATDRARGHVVGTDPAQIAGDEDAAA